MADTAINNPGLIKTYEAGGATIQRYRMVAQGATDLRAVLATGPAANLLGITGDGEFPSVSFTKDIGDAVDIILTGTVYCEYGDTVANGVSVTSDANGRAVPATSGQWAMGISRSSGVLGDVGSVQIDRHVAP